MFRNIIYLIELETNTEGSFPMSYLFDCICRYFKTEKRKKIEQIIKSNIKMCHRLCRPGEMKKQDVLRES